VLKSKEYELVPDTADLKIRAYGISLEELFKNALKGMFASIKPHGPHIHYPHDVIAISKYTVEHKVAIQSDNLEQLLVDFLTETLYLSNTNNEAYFDARFEALENTYLQATIFGVKITGFALSEIKAVTYHDLEVEQIDSLWVATLVFDV
jgi:SHS2 domain-containing protein